MGWCSATNIFDTVIEAAYKLQPDDKAMIAFAKTLRDVLENGDWDCQQESDFYDQFKWDLWPRYAQQWIDYCKEYKEDYEDREGVLHLWIDAWVHPGGKNCKDSTCPANKE